MLVFATPRIAYADDIQLTCFEVSMSSALFYDTGGTSSTTEYHRSLQLSIDTAQSTVSVTNGNGYDYESGTFPLRITDSTFEWDGNIIKGHIGYDHYILGRYTADLHAVDTPLPGERVIQMTINFKCERLQRQF
jgi:hypothetical protein